MRRAHAWRWVHQVVCCLTATLLLARAAPAFAAAPYWPRGGVVTLDGTRATPSPAPLVQLLERLFTVRSVPSRRQAGPRAPAAGPLLRALLDTTDLFVLPGFGDSHTTATPGGGSRELDTHLTAEEQDALESWVHDGGRLLVIARAGGRSAENNLPAPGRCWLPRSAASAATWGRAASGSPPRNS